MKPATIWAIFRWLAIATLLAGAFLAANHALFSIMATVAPPTNQYPEAWAFEVYTWTGISVVLLCATVIAAVNLRPGLPYLRSKWNVLLLAIALVAIVWPRAHHWLEVDRCLDAGGKWDEAYKRCNME